MYDILSLLSVLNPDLSLTVTHQFCRVVFGLLAMTGRVTMLNISRWTLEGGSYRTVQRFFNTVIPWSRVCWLFFRVHLLKPESVYLLAGDETVVSKSGVSTYGLSRFFSSVYGKSVPGLAFFGLSLVSVKERRSYRMLMEHIVRRESSSNPRSTASKDRNDTETASVKRKPGCPKGSRNRKKTDVVLTDTLKQLQSMVRTLLAEVGGFIPLRYLLLDGYFGHNNALQMTKACGLHLISKFRRNAALYFQPTTPYARRGRPPHLWATFQSAAD